MSEDTTWPRRIAIAVAAVATIGLVVATLITLVPIWPLTLFENFRIAYLVIGVGVTCGSIALRLRGYFDAALIATVFELCAIIPGMRPAASTMPAHGVPVRVLFLNVETQTKGFADVRQLIADVHPDVIGLVEVDRRWLDALAPALVEYRGQLTQPRDDNFGVALFARDDVRGSIELLGGRLPSIVATVRHAGGRFAVIVTHPLPPISGAAATALDDHFTTLAAHVATLDAPVVVMGDFNATPWSRVFVRFKAMTGLCDSRAGFGIQASWPAAFAPLRIPIDHLLASCSIGVRDRRVERDVGSDHLPVIIDLVVPRSP